MFKHTDVSQLRDKTTLNLRAVSRHVPLASVVFYSETKILARSNFRRTRQENIIRAEIGATITSCTVISLESLDAEENRHHY
jgi:hypothetical protein